MWKTGEIAGYRYEVITGERPGTIKKIRVYKHTKEVNPGAFLLFYIRIATAIK